MGQGGFFGGEVSCGVCGEHSAMLAPRAVEGKRTWRRVGNVSALLMNASHDPRETDAPLWPTIATMLLAAMVVYLPAAVGADLLQFDDNFFFGPDNPEFVRGLGAVWTEPIANAYLPVAHTSLWIDFVIAGGAPALPHIHALLLHAAAAVVAAHECERRAQLRGPLV